MPYQSAFTLFIIGGAFSATGALLYGLNYLQEGKPRRTIQKDDWTHFVQQRDAFVLKGGVGVKNK